ncbi:MAG: sigma-70 family RNA polymerase sigma factor [Acidobacteriaceae bacterium]|nr:sigma-70 family RNA polymerase sigma factor [Acidobacteriaceae bacterium]
MPLLNYRTAMEFSETELEVLRPKLRFKVRYQLGFSCPDVEDIVQETLARFLTALQNGRLRDSEARGGYLNGICQNVILEYRRRCTRDVPDAEIVAEPADHRLPETELFEMREAIAAGLQELSPRDRQVLRAFYLDEKPKSEILAVTGMTDENFRVVLCRAKERFRQIYNSQMKRRASSGH